MPRRSRSGAKEEDADEDFEPVSTPSNSRPKRDRKTLNTPVDAELTDEEDAIPKKKRAKSVAKKSALPAEPKPPKARLSTGAVKMSPQVGTPVPRISDSLESAPEERKTSQPKIALISSSNADSQYLGVPLDDLRTMLTPQEYIRVSILRSMAESAHAANEKNVSRSIHPDLAASRPSFAFESELRAMISTWVELSAVSGACIELLEAEALRYTAQLVTDLKLSATEHRTTGRINGREQRQLMFSNQEQTIDPRMAALVARTKAHTNATAAGNTPTPSATSERDKEPNNSKLAAEDDMEASEGEEDEEIESEAIDAEAPHVEEPPHEEEEYNPKAEWHSLKSASETRVGRKSRYGRIPIVTMDDLAETLVKRHISLVRRLEYIERRLAEDDRNQHINKQSKADQVAEESEDEEALLDAWSPSEDLEYYISKRDSTETTEKQHALRETILSERMERVQRMSVTHLDEWQLASSVSFARPNLSKFKAWLNVCCGWNPNELCLPPHIIVALNFVVYEHLRYIVRTSAQPSPFTDTSTNLKVLLPDRLRAEIAARIEAGDGVYTNALYCGPPSAMNG